MTADLVIRPSWKMARRRLKVVQSLFFTAVVVCAFVSVRFRATLLPVVIALDGSMVLVFVAGLASMFLYVRNASLISGPNYVAWTGMLGRRTEMSETGLELSRLVSDVSGARLPLLMLAWPADHRLFRLDIGFWEPADVDRWISAVGLPVAPAPANPVNELDLPAAYQQVLGKPRISDAMFLVLVGAGVLVAVAAVILLFHP